ncbi:MAG: prepilin-type N-terminal cleavage/methylation domain-containing protein [Pseudomonadota bacterium]
MMSLSSPQRRQAGFSLIEVLLAISLVAMIMALAYGGFRASIRATNSGEVLIEQTNQLRISHQFVRRQLSLVQSLIMEEGEEDGIQVRFIGDSDYVRFIAPMPGYLSYGGSYVQELRIEPNGENQALVYYYAMLNGYEPGEIEASDGIVLVEDVGEGGFTYLGLDPEDQEPFWEEFWEETDRLPLAVSLQMDLERGNGLIWPDLVAPVMMDSTSRRSARSLRQAPNVRRASDLIRNNARRNRR